MKVDDEKLISKTIVNEGTTLKDFRTLEKSFSWIKQNFHVAIIYEQCKRITEICDDTDFARFEQEIERKTKTDATNDESITIAMPTYVERDVEHYTLCFCIIKYIHRDITLVYFDPLAFNPIDNNVFATKLNILNIIKTCRKHNFTLDNVYFNILPIQPATSNLCAEYVLAAVWFTYAYIHTNAKDCVTLETVLKGVENYVNEFDPYRRKTNKLSVFTSLKCFNNRNKNTKTNKRNTKSNTRDVKGEKKNDTILLRMFNGSE